MAAVAWVATMSLCCISTIWHIFFQNCRSFAIRRCLYPFLLTWELHFCLLQHCLWLNSYNFLCQLKHKSTPSTSLSTGAMLNQIWCRSLFCRSGTYYYIVEGIAILTLSASSGELGLVWRWRLGVKDSLVLHGKLEGFIYIFICVHRPAYKAT